MKVTIDNLDGNGALDYTATLSGAEPLILERKLNEPSHCIFYTALDNSSLTAPAAGARVMVTADNGTMLFTGYTLAAPASIYAGMATTGPAYVLQVRCMSDELMFNARVSERTIESVATTAGIILTTLTERAASAVTSISGDAMSTPIGGFQPLAGKSWAENASALAKAARASYRVLNGSVQFASIGDQVHALAESDHSLDRGALRCTRVRSAVNDITVCGKEEPQAYVTEIFQGDGVTSVFQLSESPLLEKAVLLSDTFGGAALDPQKWISSDSGSHISLTSRGLTLGGGQGAAAAASSVSAVDAVEMGGTLLLEMMGLQIDTASEGYFAALTAGGLSPAAIFAGFHVRPSGSTMAIAPIVLGTEAGPAVTLQTGHTYTLRLHFHCKDRQRALQSYSTGGASGPVSLGGGTLTAGADLVLEVQETTGGAQFPVTVLYDGTISQAPVSCTPVAVSSVSFLGSVASFTLTRPGDVWVACTAAGSAAATQRLGASAQTAQARVTSTGRLSFYPGSVPASGTMIRAFYRIGGVAVARMATGATPAISLIMMTEQPVTRTSADCENAALAALVASTWTEGAWKGEYACWNPQQNTDIWPGDLLAIEASSAGIETNMIVRGVEVKATSCAPEMLHYTITFANEWAEPLSLKMREGAPQNAWLPTVALTAPTALASLRDLSVSSVSISQIQVQAASSPPTGGGFEVRRSDWKFGAGDGADLVLRSPTAAFTIVRQAAVERYYVRMYDGATPPNYSRFSSVIFVNVATP